MIKNNWHTHTYRCGHARGTDEEYVLSAIKAGIKKLGFSDHAPYPGCNAKGMRMNYEEYDGYVSSIKSLKEKYKDQIEIYVGLEVDYDEDQIDTLTKYRKELDYMILGQHGFNLLYNTIYYVDNKEDLYKYCELVEKACEKGFADYIAHPDVCMWTYDKVDDVVKDIANRLADVSLKYNIPLELNCGSGVKRGLQQYGTRIRYPYPTREFFEIFAKKGCDIIVGLDVHSPELLNTDEYLNRALSVVEGLNCNIVEDYDLIGQANIRKNKIFY